MKLLSSYQMGGVTLPNRIVLAPMTRSRAGEGDVPTELTSLYYVQRASAGLMIAEAAQISELAVGYARTPGIYSQQQIEAWKIVTDAVHDAGGHIFLQLFHGGRISHPSIRGGEIPVAPSAIKAEGQLFTPGGMKDLVTPRELDTDEIPKIIEQYGTATRNARSAGFDGVEIHAANGYLPNQFLCDGSNKRTDVYGGSVENRCRFVLEVAETVCAAWNSKRVGIRLSPSGIFNTMSHTDPVETFDYLVKKLNTHHLTYLHLVEPMMSVKEMPQYLTSVTPHYRALFSGTLITSGGFDRDSGNKVIEDGYADLVAYGKLFLANPDLPKRFERNADLNQPDDTTFYGGDEKGYTDYPFLSE